MDHAFRRRTSKLAELYYLQKGSDTCGLILLKDYGFEKKRRSPTVLAEMVAAANA